MTRNGTDLDLSGNFDFESLILDLLYLIIAVIGLAGNAAVLWQLCFRTQRNTFSIYILNLAAADVLYLILQIIFSLQGLITSSQFSSSSIANFLSTVTTLACIANLSILSAISTERCLSVLCPTWYRSCHPRHMSAVVCALLWALSLLLSILEGFYCDILEEDTDDGLCQIVQFITSIWLIFLFGLFLGSYLVLLTRLVCGAQWTQLTKQCVTFGLTMLVFLLFGLPSDILFFLLFWIQDDIDLLPYHLDLLACVLSCVRSCANPIIYFLVSSCRQRWKQRQGSWWKNLKLALQMTVLDIPEVDTHEGSLPQESP